MRRIFGRIRLRRPRDPADVLVPCLVACVLAAVTAGDLNYGVNGCEWNISDTPRAGGRRVRTLTTECSEGRLDWSPALTAVNIRLTSQHQILCFKLVAEEVELSVSLHSSEGLSQILYTGPDDEHTYEKCIQLPDESNWGILLEAHPSTHKSLLARVIFTFSLHQTHEIAASSDEECRPCSDKELIEVFCRSHFALEGDIHRVSESESYSELLVNAQTTLRGETHPRMRRELGRYVLYIPSMCGTSHAPGLFLFTGHIRLGRPVVRCAVRSEQWRRVREQVIADTKDDIPPCWLGDS